MRQNSKILFGFVFALAVLFFFNTPALAYTPIFEHLTPNTEVRSVDAGINSYTYTFLAADLPDSGFLRSVDIYAWTENTDFACLSSTGYVEALLSDGVTANFATTSNSSLGTAETAKHLIFNPAWDLSDGKPTEFTLRTPGSGCEGGSHDNWINYIMSNTSTPASPKFALYATESGSSSPAGAGSTALADQDFDTNFIVWADPPYTDNMVTSDFKQWQTCINLVNGATGGYYIKVNYGTSSLETFQDDMLAGGYDDFTSTTTQGLFVPFTHLPITECPISNKLHALPEGEYQAQAELWRHRLLFPDQFVATSSILNFYVASGTPVTYPGQYQQKIPCPATDFRLQFNVLTDPLGALFTSITSFPIGSGTTTAGATIDFGQGICKISDYLFTPSPQSMNNFGGLWETIKDKPPLGYFTLQQEALSDINTTTPAYATVRNLDSLGSLKTALDNGLALLVGLSFAFFMLHRIRKFDFHH